MPFARSHFEDEQLGVARGTTLVPAIHHLLYLETLTAPGERQWPLVHTIATVTLDFDAFVEHSYGVPRRNLDTKIHLDLCYLLLSSFSIEPKMS